MAGRRGGVGEEFGGEGVPARLDISTTSMARLSRRKPWMKSAAREVQLGDDVLLDGGRRGGGERDDGAGRSAGRCSPSMR
jgi:hypothetical protein